MFQTKQTKSKCSAETHQTGLHEHQPTRVSGGMIIIIAEIMTVFPHSHYKSPAHVLHVSPVQPPFTLRKRPANIPGWKLKHGALLARAQPVHTAASTPRKWLDRSV